MIVVRSRKKNEYLEPLHKTDLTVGATPHLGAHASKRDIQQFLTYFTNLFVEEVSYNIQFLTDRGENVWWLDGERVNSRSPSTSNMLNLPYANPGITLNALSEQVGINAAAITSSRSNYTLRGMFSVPKMTNGA